MYGLGCKNLEAQEKCLRASCLFPHVCPNLKTDAGKATDLLRAVRSHDKVKHTFISSGIRYDLLPYQQPYFDDLVQYHIGGLLKVAPESTSDRVTAIMRKPGAQVFTDFLTQFRQRNHRLGLRQSIVPYLISAHPGCTIDDMINVALYLKRHRLKVEQVQDFTPTPGSLSTCIYYTGQDPYSGDNIYIPRTPREKRLQKALLLYHRPESRKDILEALRQCRREDVATELFDSPPNKNRSDTETTDSHPGKSNRNSKNKQRY